MKLIESRLSVDSITKVEMPRLRHGRMIFGSSFIFALRRCRRVCFPVRKRRIQIAPTDWLSTVASAAPCTPIPRAKMKIGSRMMLMTAPITVVSMLIFAKPWVVMKGFMPSTIITKTVPRM